MPDQRHPWLFHCPITNLALGQLRFDCGPRFTLGSVAEQVHDNGPLGYGFIDVEEISPWDPAVLLSFFPRGAIFAYTDDHIHAIVSQIQPLSVPLGSIPNKCKCVILEVFLWEK